MGSRLFNPQLAPARRIQIPGRGWTQVRIQQGPPGAPWVVLKHGWVASAGPNFPGEVTVELAKDFNVLAFDMQGHGHGVRSESRFTLEQQADDAIAVMDYFGIDKAIVAGYSMGGPVAMLAALRHPDRVRGLVPCATSASFPDMYRLRPFLVLADRSFGLLNRVSRRMPKVLKGTVLPWAKLGYLKRMPLLHELAQASPRDLVQAGMALCDLDLTSRLPEITQPAAMVLTAKDGGVAPYAQEMTSRLLPDCTLYEIAKGHVSALMFPKEFAEALRWACLDVHHRALQKENQGPPRLRLVQ